MAPISNDLRGKCKTATELYVVSENMVYRGLSAFQGATNERSYRAAKRLCESLFPPEGQLAFIDAAIAARRRVKGGAL